MMGSTARDDDYGYSDLGLPIGAPRTGDPRLPPQYPTELGPMAQDLPPEARWQLGAIASQGNYRPVGGDPWNNALPERPKPPPAPGERSLMPFANWRAEPPKRTAGVVASEYMLPQSTTDLGLMAIGGPFGRAIGAAGMALDASPAEAGKVKLPAGRGPAPDTSIFRNATISRGPPRGMLTAEEFAQTSAPPVPYQEITRPNTYADPRLKAKAEAIRDSYPQYAEQYPDIGPPALKEKVPDPKKPGKYLIAPKKEDIPYATMEEALARAEDPGYFLEKKLTPEAEKFQKQRNIVMQDMAVHGYEPFFDPNKRYDVDASQYGSFDDTAVTASPKKAKTQAEWSEKYGTQEIRDRLAAGFEAGKGVPNSENWYFMGQLENEYIKELGAVEGRKAFKREFADMMAATTGGASPYDNFLMSHYANVANKRGERIDQAAWQLPFPIGGRFASGNMAQGQKYLDEGNAHWSAQNPKRYDFSTAFLGNKNAGTIDEQMMTAFDPTLKDKQPKWYGPATKTLREEASRLGVDARGFQDVGWAGLKKIKTEEASGKTPSYDGPMINQINKSIEVTHRLTGMPREEIVRRGLVLKEIPMYGLGAIGAASVMGNVARDNDYQPKE
jgi:hypothetical protein